MNRRNVILAQIEVSTPPQTLPITPAPPVIDVPVDPKVVMYAVYSGPPDTPPPLRAYSQMANVTGFLGTLVPSGPDQAELSLLRTRAADMQIGEIAHVRVGTLNPGAKGEPGLVQIVRLR